MCRDVPGAHGEGTILPVRTSHLGALETLLGFLSFP